MKTIKITLLCLFISVLSYSQDTTWVTISGNSIYDTDYNKYKISYDSILTFDLKENEVFKLQLFDDCKYCYDTTFIKIRLICFFLEIPGDRYYYYSESCRITTTHYGNKVKRIIVYPSISFVDPKLKSTYIYTKNE
jgi:hypothetical protein